MPSAISIENLAKTYPGGLTAVRDLSLEVPEGSVFGFLGPNGAGKTTTIRMIAGLARPSAGTITVAGIRREAGVAYRRQVGYLAQAPAFYGWMNARQVLEYVAGFHASCRADVRQRTAELLEMVGLAGVATQPIRTYSGGMLQRLGIAQALVGRPAAIVLDEPVSGLDPGGRRDVLALMAQLRGTTTVFYSTHILDDVQRVADHVAILNHGRLVTSAPTAELLARHSEGTLRVEIAGATTGLVGRLAALPGVISASPAVSEPGALDPEPDSSVFELRIRDGATRAVQAEVTQLAAETELALVEARPVTLDLEGVFLRLIDDQEVRAE